MSPDTETLTLDELRALSEKATPGPWRWVAEGPGPGEISLGQQGNEAEFHVLTPHVCESCRKRNARCMAPRQEDADFIAAAVNYVRTALRAEETDPMTDSPRTVELGACCDDVRCSWQPIPHIHEGREVYPAPPDRIEWTAALATEEDMPHD